MAEPLRVIMLSQYPLVEHEQALGGIMQSTFQLVGGFQELADPALNLHVVSVNEASKTITRKYAGSIHLHFIPKSSSSMGIVVIDTIRQLRYIRKLVKEVRPHVIHAQSNVAYILFSLFLGVPNVQTIHGVFRNELSVVFKDRYSFADRLRFFLKLTLEGYYLRHIDNLIAITDQIADLVRENRGGAVIIDRINNSNEPAFFATDEKLAERGRERAITILFAALITPRKGLHILTAAFRKITARYPHVKLRVVGLPDLAPDYYAQQKQAMQDLVEAGRITFTGGVSRQQMIQEYRNADIFTLPSFAESAPMAISQALCMGLPVISTRVGGIPEMIHDGENGLLVPADDVDALASALVRAINSPDERRRLALAASKVGIERYHPVSNARAILTVYRRVAATGAAGLASTVSDRASEFAQARSRSPSPFQR